MLHAQKTHRLPLPPDTVENSESDYKKILKTIMNFLGVSEFNSSTIPPFYVYSDFNCNDFDAADYVLKLIAEENGLPNAFRVFKAEQLLYQLHKFTTDSRNKYFVTEEKSFASIFIALEMMRQDEFRYNDLGCKIHIKDDNSVNCSLSKVLRWGYLFSKYCLDHRFKQIENAHYPGNLDIHCDIGNMGMHTTESSISSSFRQLNLRGTLSKTTNFTSEDSSSRRPRPFKVNTIRHVYSEAQSTEKESNQSNQEISWVQEILQNHDNEHPLN